MDNDLLLTIGILLTVLSLPALLSAWVEGRAPRTGIILIIAGLCLLGYAWMRQPGGYELAELPQVMLGALARLIN